MIKTKKIPVKNKSKKVLVKNKKKSEISKLLGIIGVSSIPIHQFYLKLPKDNFR